MLDIVDDNSTLFTLNCKSTSSPATTVILSKNNEIFTNYSLQQVLTDGSTSAYDNLIRIETSLDDIIGMYTCSVFNTAGQSNPGSINIQGYL